MIKRPKIFITCIKAAGLMAMLLSALNAEADESIAPDSTTVHKGLVGRVIDYFSKANVPRTDGGFDISFIGGPHYSSDVGFGIAALATGVYSRPVILDSVTGRSIQSETALYVDVSTTGFLSLGAGGTHVFGADRRRLEYDVSFQNFPNRYWGIGYWNGEHDKHQSKYDQISVKLNAALLFRLSGSVFVGPDIDLAWINANRRRNPAIWGGAPDHVLAAGAGGALTIDTRDNITAAEHGTYVYVGGRFYPSFMSNSHGHWLLAEGAVNQYLSLWRSAILAMRFHTELTWGDTPWCMLPTFGGSADMRGYYPGRYRDKNEMGLTAELRQHLWSRFGAVLWVGAGTVFDRFSNMDLKHVLPNFGVGLRWEFKKHSNVRVDFGIGRGQTGFVFNINEAF